MVAIIAITIYLRIENGTAGIFALLAPVAVMVFVVVSVKIKTLASDSYDRHRKNIEFIQLN